MKFFRSIPYLKITMPNHYQSNHSTAVGFHDILYALRRRRVLITSLALCGLLLAAWVHLSRNPVYASDAKLLVRYVLERGSVDPYEMQQNPGAAKADQVIQTEIEILTSMDLCASGRERCRCGENIAKP